ATVDSNPDPMPTDNPAPAEDPFEPGALGAAITVMTTGDFADRAPGTMGDHRSADFVAGKLESLGMAVTRQKFTDSHKRATENVIAVWASTGASHDVIVVGAHRDHLPADGA